MTWFSEASGPGGFLLSPPCPLLLLMALIEKKLRGGHHNLSAPTASYNGQVLPNCFHEKMLKNNTAEGLPT